MKKISTHQFCLFAGNFYCMSDPMNENEKSKLHLHFKKGPEIDNNSIETFFNIFSLLREGIQWFEKKLNMAFPYKKIEVVFVPEYKNVATSHPGAVIFIDLKFLKEKCDVLDKEYFKFLLISQMYFIFIYI